MRKILPFIFSAILVITLCSCQGDKEYTINPDGSAKVKITGEWLRFNDMVNFSKGVDTWSDLKTQDQDGTPITTVIAYIPDITNYRINAAPGPPILFQKTEEGSFELMPQRRGSTETAKELSPDEIDTALPEIKSVYERQKKMFAKELSGTKESSVSIKIAGKPETSTHFKEDASGTMKMSFSSASAKQVFDSIDKDEEKLKELARFGMRGFNDEMRGTISQAQWGTKEDPTFKFSPSGDSLFDYQAEVAAAKANEREMLLSSGLYRTSLPEEPANNPIGEVTFSSAVIENRSKSPDRVAVRFRAKIAENVVHGAKVEIVSAIDSEGGDCFPKLGYKPEGLISISKNQGDLGLVLYMKAPPSGKYKSIDCVIHLGTADNSLVKNLGKTDLKVPFNSHGIEAEMLILAPGENGQAQISYTYNSTEPFSQLKLIQDDGKERIDRQLLGAKAHRGTTYFSTKKGFSSGHFELTTYENFKLIEIPITLTDITVAGMKDKP